MKKYIIFENQIIGYKDSKSTVLFEKYSHLKDPLNDGLLFLKEVGNVYHLEYNYSFMYPPIEENIETEDSYNVNNNGKDLFG